MINKSDDQEEAGSPICQSWVWLQTELDNTKSYYQLIITVIISENNQINTFRANMCSRDNVYVKNSSTLEIPQLF